jgi:hypothetical protein
MHPQASEIRRARDAAARLLTSPERLVGSPETELVPALDAAELGDDATARLSLVNTLTEPTTIGVDASEHRATVAQRAGILSAALDAAQSAGASNSVEKMLAHQVTAAHMAGMDLLIRVEDDDRLPPVERARLIKAAARMFDVSQSGCLALQKLQTRGQQHVNVQHQQVNVTHGQAIVAAIANPRGCAGDRIGNG